MFFDWLMKQKFDIVILSETHSKTDAEVQQWVQEGAGKGRPWQGQAFWCHNTQPGSQRPVRGVGILLRDRVVPVGVGVTIQHIDTAGRLLRIGWEHSASDRWSIVAVYAPSVAAERNSFFAGAYYEALDSGPANSKLIVGGDFNCATSALDVQPLPGQMAAHSARLVGGQHLQTVNSLFALIDSVRHLHPALHQPTHYQGFSQTTGGSSTAAAAAGTSAAAAAAAARGDRQSGSPAGSSDGSNSGSASAAVQGGRLDYIFVQKTTFFHMKNLWRVAGCRQLSSTPDTLATTDQSASNCGHPTSHCRGIEGLCSPIISWATGSMFKT